MSKFGEIWQRFTGGDHTLPHCEAHTQYQSDCAACVALRGARVNPWQPEFVASDDSMAFVDGSSGGDVGTTGSDSVDSSGFDGFSGGDSGGGGASGDW